MKHLSTLRKRYSVSSGERKRRSLNLARVIAGGRCVWGVVGHACEHSAECSGSDKMVWIGERSGKAYRRG